MTLRTLLFAACSLVIPAAGLAQEETGDRPSFLTDFLRSLSIDAESAEAGDALSPDADGALPSLFLSDSSDSSDIPDDHFDWNFDFERFGVETVDGPVAIPAPPPAAPVFAKQPEDDVSAVVERQTFPYPAFDFSGGTPTLFCMPARVCSVELEPGEVILGRAIGDPDRWLYQELAMGEGDRARVLLALMPKVFGARTNLLVTTDRRVYTLALASAAIDQDDDDASAPLTERARFSYPRAWAEARHRPRPKLDAVVEEPKAQAAPASPGQLDFRYTTVEPRKRKRRFSWQPTVYDDGRFTYLLLPTGLATLPAVRGRDANQEPFLLNETYHHGERGTYIAIPRLVNELELILGTGRDRKTMTIHRNVRLP